MGRSTAHDNRQWPYTGTDSDGYFRGDTRALSDCSADLCAWPANTGTDLASGADALTFVSAGACGYGG